MTDQPNVRRALPADISAMHAIRLSVRENRLGADAGINEASYKPFIAAGGAWVAELNQRIVGFAILDRHAQSVWALFVEPSAEASGIGYALHSAMLGWAAEQGMKRLWLETSGGTRADRFYRRHGWKEVGPARGNDIRFERAV